MILSRILCTVSLLHQQPIHGYLVFYDAEESHAYKDEHTLNLEQEETLQRVVNMLFQQFKCSIEGSLSRKSEDGITRKEES